LGAFGVPNVWSDPDFQIFQGSTPLVFPNYRFTHYGDWSADPVGVVAGATAAGFQKVFSYVGAFPLAIGSKDAAEITQLGPGAYTIVSIGANGDAGGEALIEVYLPP
jgi:hypothetical protein